MTGSGAVVYSSCLRRGALLFLTQLLFSVHQRSLLFLACD